MKIDTDLFGDEVYIHQEDSDLQVVEDLLETYFAHIDSTYAELDAIDQVSAFPNYHALPP